MSVDQRPDRYERPLSRHLCGRNIFWQKSCPQGPKADGTCGGAVSCSPVKQGGGYKCTRSKSAGGPCSQGPLQDGGCAKNRPPCVPKLRIRSHRKRLSLLALIVALGMIGAFSNTSEHINPSIRMLDAGHLSDIHTGFTQDEGCASCHTNHNDSPFDWVKAAFSKNDMSSECLDCHSFNEPELAPHNFSFTSFTPETDKTQCVSCHSEHKGKKANLNVVTQSTCSNCHKVKFDNFVDDHPEFPPKYPSGTPDSIKFNHNQHINDYFVEAKWQGKKSVDKEFSLFASKNCTACHEVETAARKVKAKPYAQICGNCHQSQITSREFKIIAAESFTPVSALLLGISEDDEDDEDALDEHLEFLQILAENPDEAMLDFADELTIAEELPMLVKGLNSILVKKAAENWLNEDEFIENDDMNIKQYGWVAGGDDDGEQTLRYRAVEHADPVILSWIELFLNETKLTQMKENIEPEIIERVRDYLLDPQEGPGACAKCHQPGLVDRIKSTEGISQATWNYRGQVERHFSKYSHGIHIKFLGPKKNCQFCHQLDSDSDYEAYFDQETRDADDFLSNFRSISKVKCAECHQPEKARDDCVICHNYHLNPGYKEKVMVKKE